VIEFSTANNSMSNVWNFRGLNPVDVVVTPAEVYAACAFSVFSVNRPDTVISIMNTMISCIVATTQPGHPYSLLLCLWDGRIFVVANGKVKIAVPAFQPLKQVPILCASFAPNERHLIVGRRDATVAVIDTKTWTEVATFVCSSPVTSVAVSPKSQLIIAGDALGKVYLLKYFRR